MSKQQFIWVGAVIALGFGILIWAQEPGNYMLAELIGAGLPVALFGTALIAVGAAFIRKEKMKSVSSLVIAITAVGAYSLSYADIYKCTINGEVFFSASKCGHDAVKINTDPPPRFSIHAGPPHTLNGRGQTTQPEAGEDWVKITESKNGQVMLIHRDSIKVLDGMVRHWTKLETYSSVGAPTRKEILSHLTDCNTETQARTSGFSYENDNLVFSHTEPPDTKLAFKAHPPGTVGAFGIAFICRIFKNGWLPFPQLYGGGEKWEEIPARSGLFIDKESIGVIGGLVRYHQKTVYEFGYVKFKVATNCANSTLAVTENLTFDVSEKFEPNLSFNLEVERPPLKFHRAEGESEPARKFACDYVQAQARVVRGSRKAR